MGRATHTVAERPVVRSPATPIDPRSQLPPTAGAYAGAQVREAAASYLPGLVFRLGPQLSDRLRLAAFARRRTPTAMATELLQRGLERESQRQRAEAALAILTPREREVARLAVGGHTNREIGQALVISPETVKTHMRNLLGKFGLSSKSELRIQLRDLDGRL